MIVKNCHPLSNYGDGKVLLRQAEVFECHTIFFGVLISLIINILPRSSVGYCSRFAPSIGIEERIHRDTD